MRSSPDKQPPTPWHALSAEAVLALSHAAAGGLTQAEADVRLQTHGPNRLAEVEPPGLLARLLRQFNNLLLYVLMAAALVTALMGHWVDTAVIMAVVVLNAVIGFVQEGKAEKALQAIRHLLSPHAVVLRDGHQREVDAADSRAECAVAKHRVNCRFGRSILQGAQTSGRNLHFLCRVPLTHLACDLTSQPTSSSRAQCGSEGTLRFYGQNHWH